MRTLLSLMLALAILFVHVGCEDKDVAKRLKERTDINLVGAIFQVSLVKREDLDRVGYAISFPKNGEDAFQSAVENAAGTWCWQFLIDRSACHYKSKAGHDIFIEKERVGNYLIYTSG